MKCLIFLIVIASVLNQRIIFPKSEEFSIRDMIENQFAFDNSETSFNSAESSVSIESFESFESISEEIISESESIEEEISTFRPFFLNDSPKKLNRNLKKSFNQQLNGNFLLSFRLGNKHY